MKPKYPIGSLIYVNKKIVPEEIKIGDAITFYMKDSKIVATHQVYKIDYENKEFYTEGINNFDSNGEIIHDTDSVSFEDFIGKPIFVIPVLGYINNIITTKPGSIIIIILTTVLIIISYLLERGGKIEN